MRSIRIGQPPSSTTATTPRKWLRSASTSAAAAIFRAASRVSTFFSSSCATALCSRRMSMTNERTNARQKPTAVRIEHPLLGWSCRLSPRHLRGSAGAVELRDGVHLTRRQLRRNRAHLLIDVILAHTLSEGRQLALDIGEHLTLQSRRAELAGGRTMTDRARRNAARRVSGKYESNRRIFFAKGVPGLETLADGRRQSIGAARKIGPDIGRISRRQRLRDRVHGAPRPLARAKVVELLVDDGGIHARQGRKQARPAHPLLTMAGGAIQRDERAVFDIAAGDLCQRRRRPGDARRRAQRRLRCARPPPVGGNAKRTANRRPRPQRRSVLLLAA